MYSVFLKEINSFFSSIVGYITMLVFLVASGLFVWIIPDTSVLDYGYATLDRFFELAPWLLLLLIPAVTMRSFSDEYRAGTIEWLYTKPLSELDIVLGKYLASLLLVVFALLPTLIYVYSIGNLAATNHQIDTGGIAGSYVGLVFLAATFTAIGVFSSSLTGNQVVAFMISLVACWLLYVGFESLSKVPAFTGGFDFYLSMVGMSFHYESMSRGVLDTRDVIYFLSMIVLFTALTRLALARRTWDAARGA